jgi:hypothetical protein
MNVSNQEIAQRLLPGKDQAYRLPTEFQTLDGEGPGKTESVESLQRRWKVVLNPSLATPLVRDIA